MRVRTRTFWLPKDGNSPDEYEDAAWPEEETDRETKLFRCAVADGATETSFAGQWATLLVESFGRGEVSHHALFHTLPAVRQRWLNSVSTKELPWYAEAKLESGAYSSLIGLTLAQYTRRQAVMNRWTAVAVGDSCLFHLQGDMLVEAFPLGASGDFTSRPYLLSTRENGPDPRGNADAVRRGTWETGSRFFLMTDALACWFLESAEAGRHPWEEIDALTASSHHLDFAAWIAQLRGDGHLKNDDVTLLYVEVT